MEFTRRDLLKFAGGASAGLVFTPVPWSLLHDTAVLSENWPGVPEAARGEIRTRYTTCTMCPAGCGVRARCVGDRPVSLSGVPKHPASYGALCPVGLVGHHLPFCGDRAVQPLENGKPVSLEQALAGIGAAIGAGGHGESVAILDPRPGRAASLVYRRFLAGLANGVYCAPPDRQPYGPFGIDLEHTRTILSFGAPVLDNWLAPGRVLANRSHFRLIQVEPAYSRTASLADLWVPISPGGEAAFAADVTRALKGESAAAPAVEVARMLLDNQPAIAVGGGAAAAELNASLGCVGKPGGFLRRRDFQPAANLAMLPDRSIRVLLCEEDSNADPLPWSLVQTKLVPQNAVVVALTPWRDGYAKHADYVIPAPVYLESTGEAPTPTGSPVASFSLSPALLAAPAGVTSPTEVILRLARDSRTYLDVLKQRVAALKKDSRGTLFTYKDAKSVPVSDFASANELWEAFLGGAVWSDDPLPQSPRPQSPAGFRGPAAETGDRLTLSPEYPLALIAADSPPAHASPLMSKLYRESGLRRPADAAALHPETGRAQGLDAGCRALVNSPSGAFTVQAVFDPAVMPGVIEMAGSAVSPANIRRA
jgi:anaerobic selenocysteine-containing dehydrogenase